MLHRPKLRAITNHVLGRPDFAWFVLILVAVLYGIPYLVSMKHEELADGSRVGWCGAGCGGLGLLWMLTILPPLLYVTLLAYPFVVGWWVFKRVGVQVPTWLVGRGQLLGLLALPFVLLYLFAATYGISLITCG